MPIDKGFFRLVMGRFATGVTIVTASSHEALVGITVNSFCSVSLDPPLVLVCIDLKSNTLQHFRESGSLAINILSDQQEHLSRCFATPSQERYEQFCHANYYLSVTGSPIINNALAFIDTRIVAEYPGGDHAIFIGQVVALGAGGQVAFADDTDEYKFNLTEYHSSAATDDVAVPLAYYRGQYRHLANDYQRPSLAMHNKELSYVKASERS